MTGDNLSDLTISSNEEFESVLGAVVEKAIEADIDVRGAWDFETRDSSHYWEVEIVELMTQPEESEE